MGVEIEFEPPFCPRCGYPTNFDEAEGHWDCPNCWASSEDDRDDDEPDETS